MSSDIAERMTVETIEQLRVIADPYRLNILRMLCVAPATVKMLADRIGDVSGKVHYHVRELERLGFVRLVSKQEKGGVIEKYFRAVARSYEPRPDLLRVRDDEATPPHHVQLASRVRDEFIHVADVRLAAEADDAEGDGADTLVACDVGDQFYLTNTQVRELHAFITAMLDDARTSSPSAGDDRHRYTIGLFIYPHDE